jgi:predicted NUDIX family NTP pyrophosphohydrolase
MPVRSAGILLYRRTKGGPEVLLVHPGGPFWAKKDDGAWSIPKGLLEPGEDALAAARREFREETGAEPPAGEAFPLGDFRYTSGKIVTAFALEGEFALKAFKSTDFEMEWPPKSGRMQKFPEADRAAWLSLESARRRIVKGQLAILAALVQRLAAGDRR